MEVIISICIVVLLACIVFSPAIIAVKRNLKYLPAYMIVNTLVVGGIYVYPSETIEGFFCSFLWLGLLLSALVQRKEEAKNGNNH